MKIWRAIQQDFFLSLGILFLFLIILGIVIGPYFYHVSFDAIDVNQSNLGPSWGHLFGTNDLGQDQLARVLLGGRISLSVSLAAMLVAISLGTLIGAIAGFYGGILDLILMRFTDLFLSLPQLPLLLLIVYLFRDSVIRIAGAERGIFILVVLVIGGLNWMSVARLVRADFLKIKEMEFIKAAQSLGAKPIAIIVRHILPNVMSVIIVASTLAMGNALIIESTLSFLGLGFPPDLPTWGRMLFEAQNYITSHPHLVVFPGLAIFLTVLSINAIGNGLRDLLDPKAS
ncbi:ABC transporter permease [Gloeocapsa sp. PCC 73106]|uniref:ABC transporter permease n=1 Tax=Gloeocapsa sp. PCC 73106 TaxID=102232 RepID=UPI0002ACB404|nr:ABC transporter permease [Gloeocapsa sp. PCC 73106]ELS00245.1 ABC-type dipeptide/oligopeptide/nickel transport system, permease component [Gloeocapsa sp. PCC 73106]